MIKQLGSDSAEITEDTNILGLSRGMNKNSMWNKVRYIKDAPFVYLTPVLQDAVLTIGALEVLTVTEGIVKCEISTVYNLQEDCSLRVAKEV